MFLITANELADLTDRLGEVMSAVTGAQLALGAGATPPIVLQRLLEDLDSTLGSN